MQWMKTILGIILILMVGNERFSRFVVSLHKLVVTIFYIISVWCTKHALQKHYNSMILSYSSMQSWSSSPMIIIIIITTKTQHDDKPVVELIQQLAQVEVELFS